MINRRAALTSAASLFGVALAPKALTSAPLPPKELLRNEPEKFWLRIREEQFYMPDWRVFLNNGSLGVMPKPVFQAVADYMRTGASLVNDTYPRWGYEVMEEQRGELAAFFGCKRDELALVHSATTAMSIIAAGLDLHPGDEVLITDQEHPSGRGCWEMKAARFGTTVRAVKVPQTPRSRAEVVDIVTSAIGPKTRVVSFSGINTTTGLIMPIKEICAFARSRGVISVVDGAHMHGQIPVNISDLGPDFMAGSPHKWMFAPAGSGLLYIREEWLDRLWPTIVSGSWNDKNLKAARFMIIGTNNRAIMEGMLAGLHFGQALGYENVYKRMHNLAKLCLQKARQMPELIDVLTPDDDSMFGSIAAIRFKKDVKPLLALCRKRRIWHTGTEMMRISTHIHTRPGDLDIFFQTVKEALA